MAKSRIRKFRESFLYAGRGLRLCITGERNFRVHMTAAFYVTAAAVMGHVTSTEAAVLCLCFGLTMGALCLLVHLSGLESLGQPYLAPFSGVSGARSLLRARLVKNKFRDAALHPQDVRNQR